MTATFDREDLHFQLFEALDVEALFARPAFEAVDRDIVEAMVETASQLAGSHFAPHAALLDAEPPEYQDGAVVAPGVVQEGLDAYREAGFTAAAFPEAVGGTGLPESVHQALAFIFSSANISMAGYGLLAVGAARLIESFGSEEQKKRYLLPMVEGRFYGTMCLSEPHAGSGLADITTKAVPQDDGSYLLTGRKMWISAGDHPYGENIVHMVLAKVPGGPSGVKGISLFIVPKYRLDADGNPAGDNDVTLAGLNHKMGYRGITNCALNFGEKGACRGELVGEVHHGLAYMFQMMNEARIGVGLGATALAQAGYQASLDYAKERPQGRHPDNRDADSPPMMIIEHADVRRLLLAQKAAAEAGLALGLYCARLVDEVHTAPDDAGRQDAQTLLDTLTPIAKSWPSEFCLEANKHAIQVLGGAGYTTDYPVERLYRDNRLNHIHEGTHAIQGMDLLGRKMVMKGGAGREALVSAIKADIARADGLADEEVTARAATLTTALDTFGKVTDALMGALMADPRRGLANATLYLDMTGHIVMAWMWLRQEMAAVARAERDGDSAFMNGKRQAARYFFSRELPRINGWAETLLANDQSAYDMQADWF